MSKFRFNFVMLLFILATGLLVADLSFAVTTTMQINVVPTSITPDGTATVTATVTPATGTINCGNGQIQYKIDYYDPLKTDTGFIQLGGIQTPSNNQFSAVFNPTALTLALADGDKVTFRAGYTSTGPPSSCPFDNQAIGQTPTVDLMIVESNGGACPNGQTEGVYIAIVGPDGNGMPGPGETVTASFKVQITACEDVYDVTAQGGDNGWAPTKSCAPGITPSGMTCEPRNENKRTNVWLWTIGDLAQGQTAETTVTVSGDIKNKSGECGKDKYLNGDWSALYAVEAGGPRTKSDYTEFKSYITVTCP
jgi:hypothetical protein